MQEKLQNEVTKTKEKLENLLTETNEEIKLGERIKKITNKIEKEDKNIIKIISFISKIKESIQNMIETTSKPLKNIKFNFEEEKRTINFEEYSLFEGIDINKIDSVILGESNRKGEFLKLLFEWTGCKNIELLYRGTRDGMTSKNFHDKCDNQGKTITLYKNNKGNIFGGYASIPWTNKGEWKDAPNSFIFTLTNNYNYKPTKFPKKIKDAEYTEVFHKGDYGPTFGNDLGLYSNFNKKGWALKFKTFQDILGKTNSLFTGNEDENYSSLSIKELEVFKLL